MIRGITLVLVSYLIIRMELYMATNPSPLSRADFDAALQAGVTTIISKIDDLAAKVASGTVTTPEDFSAELAILKTAVDESLAKDPDAPTA